MTLFSAEFWELGGHMGMGYLKTFGATIMFYLMIKALMMVKVKEEK